MSSSLNALIQYVTSCSCKLASGLSDFDLVR